MSIFQRIGRFYRTQRGNYLTDAALLNESLENVKKEIMIKYFYKFGKSILQASNLLCNIVFESLDKMINDNIAGKTKLTLNNPNNKKHLLNLNGLPDPEKYIRSLIAVLKDKEFIYKIKELVDRKIKSIEYKNIKNIKDVLKRLIPTIFLVEEKLFREMMLNFTISLLTKTNRISFLKESNKTNIKSNILNRVKQLKQNINTRQKQIMKNLNKTIEESKNQINIQDAILEHFGHSSNNNDELLAELAKLNNSKEQSNIAPSVLLSGNEQSDDKPNVSQQSSIKSASKYTRPPSSNGNSVNNNELLNLAIKEGWLK